MAKWRIGVAALTLAVLGPVPRVLAQTYAPTFDLVVSGTIVQVTHDQTFDYGAHPPGASIAAQLHNGPNPECVFTATRSDTGASQYQNIGGSNGYDTSGRYTDPPPVVLALPLPIVWTLTLACGQAAMPHSKSVILAYWLRKPVYSRYIAIRPVMNRFGAAAWVDCVSALVGA